MPYRLPCCRQHRIHIGATNRPSYYDDGRVKFSHDAYDQRFDRSYGYDQAGRLAGAYSGPLARGEADTNLRPYKQDYTFDVWGNLTSRTGKHWSHNNTFFGTYVNNRMEGTSNPGNPDVGLGLVATALGSGFDGDYKMLAQDVWHRVCGQSSDLNIPKLGP